MKCFNHESVAAIGVCRGCGKGICRSCVIERPGGLACSSGCVERIDAMADLLDSSIAEQNPPARFDYRPIMLMLVLGVTFATLLTQPYVLGLFCLAFGVLTLVYRLIQHWRAARQRNKRSTR